MCVRLGKRGELNVFASGHSKDIGRQDMPRVRSLAGLGIGIMTYFFHITVIRQVETGPWYRKVMCSITLRRRCFR